MNLLLQGLSNQEIAAKLGISLWAVKHTIFRIANKYKIDRRKFHPRVRLVYLYTKGEE